MEIDINRKTLAEQDLRQLVHSLEVVSARTFEAIVKAGQLASQTTPEMQLLFEQWLGCISGMVAETVKKDGKIDVEGLAREIGVTPATVLSLALTLHREGTIKITELKAEAGPGMNTEICPCLRAPK